MKIRSLPKMIGCVFVMMWAVAMMADQVHAQRGGRGGDRGGGDRGGGDRGGRGGGGPPGMMRGGGPPGMMMGGGPPGMMGGGPGMRGGFGGPGGGYGGPGGGFGASSFISRLDRNGNRMLDPDEIDGRMRGMFERMAGDAKLDLSRPIPLEAITRAFDRMREQRMREMGGGDPRSRGDDRRDDRGSSGSSSRSDPDYEPLVPGFGEVDLFDPVPGFGDLGERFAVKTTDADRQEASRTMSRNDSNKDGILDAEEIRRGRWSGDPLSVDRNRDGKLTLNELTLRYALRRVEREGSSDSSRTSGGRSSSSRDSSSSRSSSDSQNRIVEMIMGRYDRNRNGVIDGDEIGQIRGGGAQYDANKDGKVTKDELAKGMAGRFGSRGGDQGGSSYYTRRDGGDSRGGDSRGGGSKDASGDSVSDRWYGRKSYRSLSPSERLADFEGLPEWFSRSDADQDGQIRMSEYATSWDDDVVADFNQFDLNGDGIVTPTECLHAVDGGAVQGAAPAVASSTSSGYSGRSYTSTSRTEEKATNTESSSSASEVASAAPANVDQQYVSYAVKLIKKYDSNKDGVWTKDEWAKTSKDYSAGDTDGDGRITPVELAAEIVK